MQPEPQQLGASSQSGLDPLGAATPSAGSLTSAASYIAGLRASATPHTGGTPEEEQRPSNRDVVRANRDDALMRIFLPWFLCFCCSLCILVPLLCGTLLWMMAEVIIERETKCDMPLQMWVLAALGGLAVHVLLFLPPMPEIISCCCMWHREPGSREPPPCRVSAVFFSAPCFSFFWDIVGLLSIAMSGKISSDEPSCRAEAPGLCIAVVAYCSLNIFMLIFWIVYTYGFYRLLLAMVRAGLLNSSHAAPKGTLERSTQPIPPDHASIQDDPQCSICLAALNDQQAIVQVTACSHVFHMVCLAGWLHVNRTCPLCRLDLAGSGDTPASSDAV
eukprot:NODE_4389_length_1897_cov_13.497740.p1 GENE.NODE_4389_length_1897_cov_13.497740~~NODE_4389_length_1897_cov_13.497740.p1  ORF type:complete len:332 (-),score=48.91 NODE_4389_length_1897_cov_13.497740:566-1561(-)